MRPGTKQDDGKPLWNLLPWKAVGLVVDVLTYGAKKYSPDNWRDVPEGKERYLSAALRHLSAYAQGEDIDAESGLPHLAHAATCILFMLEL